MTNETTFTTPDSTTGKPEVGFIVYLKKILREMPLTVCREILAVHQVRLSNKAIADRAAGTLPDNLLNDYVKLVGLLQTSIERIDAVIDRFGSEAKLGDDPEFDEDTLAGAALTALRW